MIVLIITGIPGLSGQKKGNRVIRAPDCLLVLSFQIRELEIYMNAPTALFFFWATRLLSSLYIYQCLSNQRIRLHTC